MNVMAESPVYQEILNQGRAEGEAKGLAEGEAKGRAQGLRKAIELGLEIRFGSKAEKLRPLVTRCSLVELERATEVIKTVQSLEEFKRAIGARNHRAG